MSFWVLLVIVVVAYMVGRSHGRASVARDVRDVIGQFFNQSK